MTWALVNLVNGLQALGSLSRLESGSMVIQRSLGYVMMALALPAVVALVAFLRAGSHLAAVVGAAPLPGLPRLHALRGLRLAGRVPLSRASGSADRSCKQPPAEGEATAGQGDWSEPASRSE